MNAIRKNWLYPAVGGGAAVLVLIIVLVVVLSQPGPDLTGTYELLLEGKLTGTVVDIAASGDEFSIKFTDHGAVRSEYLLPKPRTNRFSFDKTADGQTGLKFNLEKTDAGYKGTVDIPALAGNVEVYLRRVQQ